MTMKAKIQIQNSPAMASCTSEQRSQVIACGARACPARRGREWICKKTFWPLDESPRALPYCLTLFGTVN